MHDDEPSDRPPSDPNEDFAAMLEESLAPKSYREGETISGIIVAVGSDVAFVDVGGKGEATIALEELADPEGETEVKVGDTVQAVVVSTSGGLKLSHKLARGAATRQRLGDAYRAGLPVEGRVEKTIKGGFETRFASPDNAPSARSLRSIQASPPSRKPMSGSSTRSGFSSTKKKEKTSSFHGGSSSRRKHASRLR